MKTALLIALLVPIVSLAQSKPPKGLEWVPTKLVTTKINAGWTFGSVEGMCIAVDPTRKIHVTSPRKDGKCHAEDTK